MRTGIDIDGVIYPWHYSIYRYFTEFRGFEGGEHEFWEELVPTIPESTMDYYVSLPFLYSDTTPTQDAINYLPKLAELGEVFYITSRPIEVYHQTKKFLDKYNFPFRENLIFTKSKANEIRVNKVDYFLDDQGKHIDELKGVTEAYLFQQIHNRKYRDQYNFLTSIKQYYELIRDNNGK